MVRPRFLVAWTNFEKVVLFPRSRRHVHCVLSRQAPRTFQFPTQSFQRGPKQTLRPIAAFVVVPSKFAGTWRLQLRYISDVRGVQRNVAPNFGPSRQPETVGETQFKICLSNSEECTTATNTYTRWILIGLFFMSSRLHTTYILPEKGLLSVLTSLLVV
jgi:hypothetical protein